MWRKSLFCAAVLTGVTAWSVDLLTDYGVPAVKGKIDRVVAVSSPLRADSKMTLPYYQTFDAETSMSELSSVTNQNGKVWKWIQSCPTFNESCAKVETNSYVPGGLRAYLTLPAVELKAGKYNFEFDAWGQSDFNPEFISACYATGNTLDDFASATEIVSPTQLAGYCYVPNGGEQQKQHFAREVDIPADGTYYFAITPAKTSAGLAVFVDNIALAQAVAAAAPGVPELTVVADNGGELKAVMTAKAPVTDANGDPLEEISGIRLYRGATFLEALTPDASGTVSFTDVPPSAGNWLYRAIAFNSAGPGDAALMDVYVGHARPAAPDSFYATHGSTTSDVVLEWETPLDIYGKTFTTDNISYTIKVTKPENIDWFDPLVEDFHGNTYSFKVPDLAGEQAFLRFSFVAANRYGQESDTYFPDVRIPVGTPYTVPFNESFAGGMLSYLFRTKMEGNFGMWGLSDDEIYAGSGLSAQDGDNGFIVYAGMEDGDAAGLYSGIIDLNGVENPALSFYYFGEDTSNELRPWVKAGKDFEPLGDAIVMSDGNEGEWNHKIYSLLPYAGKRVELALRATSKGTGMIAVDNFSVFDQLGHDLAVTLSAPAKVNVGEAVVLRANVSNMGARPAGDYKVAFYCNGKRFAAVDAPGELAAAADVVVEQSYIAFVANGEQAYEFRAEIEYEADQDASNNVSNTVTVQAVKSIHPAPRNLAAELDGTTVRLTWEAPDTDVDIILPETEGFEDAEAWATGSASGWTFVDADRGASGFFNDFDIPAVTGGEPASWFVIDGSDENCRYYGLTPHSGKKCIAVLYNADGSANDDWAVSPLLPATAQTVSFFARSYSGGTPDDFEVLYSSGSASTADFKPIPGAKFSKVSSSWTEYVVKLPAGAKYFAIRYTSTDAFCLLVDDITFCAADGDKARYTLTGYNVYRNGLALNDAPVAETAYSYAGVDLGAANDFHVTAIYRGYGESAPSNVVTVGLSGIGAVDADTSAPEYFDLRGLRVTDPRPGEIYIVRRGTAVTKEIAR